MNKAEFRKLFTAKRASLDPADVAHNSTNISKLFFENFSLENYGAIHIFLSILERNEVNTWNIIEKIKVDFPQIKIILPVCDLSDCSMKSYELTETTILKKNEWNIPEPLGGKLFPDDKIDLMLIPLLAFDTDGYRVGYGKGFYDRYLKKCKKDIVKVGLSLFDPVLKIDDINQYDEKMDYCITQGKVFKF